MAFEGLGFTVSIAGAQPSPSFAGVLTVLGWGLAFGGVSVTLQSWILQVAETEPEAGTSLLVCVFNLAIAAGALIGGIAADRYGVLTANVLSAAPFASVIPAIVVGERAFRRRALTSRSQRKEGSA